MPSLRARRQLLSEERYFFWLSAFQGRLQALYRYRPQLLQPGARRQEVERFDHNDFCEGLKIIQRLIALVARALADGDPTRTPRALDKKGRFPPLIHDACQALAIITLILHPAAPRATDAVWKNLSPKTRLEDQLIDEMPWSVLKPEVRWGLSGMCSRRSTDRRNRLHRWEPERSFGQWLASLASLEVIRWT